MFGAGLGHPKGRRRPPDRRSCSARVSGTGRVAAVRPTVGLVRRGSPTPPSARSKVLFGAGLGHRKGRRRAPGRRSCSARVSDPAVRPTVGLLLTAAVLLARWARSPTTLSRAIYVQPSIPTGHFVLNIRRASLPHKDYGNAVARSRRQVIRKFQSRNLARMHLPLMMNRHGAARDLALIVEIISANPRPIVALRSPRRDSESIPIVALRFAKGLRHSVCHCGGVAAAGGGWGSRAGKSAPPKERRSPVEVARKKGPKHSEQPHGFTVAIFRDHCHELLPSSKNASLRSYSMMPIELAEQSLRPEAIVESHEKWQ